MEIDTKGKRIFIISGPSGAGKGSIVAEVLKKVPKLSLSVSVTTRSPRLREEDGVDYYFLTKEDFQKRIEQGEFLEWAQVHNHFYGTLISYVQGKFDLGYDIILEIDPQGATQVKKKVPSSLLLFIAPPSFKELESRLKKRQTESYNDLWKRLRNAPQELQQIQIYDYVIVNDILEKAISEVIRIIETERRR